ncbi:DUF7115 domain-containing protein [Natronomonas sp. EA1]|uniref:DUF7115 domain-containing protein n=1 Tax=Natronomonas sp. EA1 TaxID=3421655 RepID=UPI003EBED962
MELPELVRQELNGESVGAQVALGGDDAVFVTPTRTLVYRSEGLLSDESVTAYDHDVERLTLSSGRRKATFTLTYIDDEETFAVPAGSASDVLSPLLGGILRRKGVIDEDERVRSASRFSELTLVVTDARMLKHVGGAVWDDDYEEYRFAETTDFDTEEGSVATQLVIEVDGRPQRVKVPNDNAPAIAHAVRSALLAYHGIDSIAELRAEKDERPERDHSRDFEESNIKPLVGEGAEGSAQEATQETADDGFAFQEAPREPDTDEDLAAEVAELRAAVERQNEVLEKQGKMIQQLIEELRRGR